jgi:hypothetical protein
MSALGQKRTCAPQKAMSALPPIATAKADISVDRGRERQREIPSKELPIPLKHPRLFLCAHGLTLQGEHPSRASYELNAAR